jgi:MFS transporter, DHA2 family, multidrug resistance protein
MTADRPTPPAPAGKLSGEPSGKPDGLPARQRVWAVFASGLAVMMAVLDGAMTNIALPTIATEFGTAPAASIWVVNGYQLAVTISLLPLAALGDGIGYAKVFRAGLLVFLAASLLCTLATSLPALTAARVLQGFGAAGIMSVNTAMIRFIHPRNELGRGIGINTMIVGASSAVGPTVAAAILALGGWRWLYAVNIPLVIAALAFSRNLPAVAGSGRPFDWTSTALNAVTLGLFILALSSAAQGQRPWITLLQFMAAGAVGIYFVRLQLLLPAPILPVDLLRIPVIALSIATSILSFAGQMLAYVSLPFHFQGTLGRTVVETGLLMTPWPVCTVLMAPVAGRLADRYPAGILGGIGLSLLAAGLLLLAAVPLQASSIDIAWRMALCGIGFGLSQTPNNRAILMTAPLERTGGAGGMLSTARLVGQTTGAALVALIFGWLGRSDTVLPLVLGAGCVLLGAMTSSLRLRQWKQP